MWRSKPSASEACRNRATVVTSVVKPKEVQPVHAGGLQSPVKSDLLQDFTTAESSRPGYDGMGSFPHGGCGPDSAACGEGEESWARQIAGKTRGNARKISAHRNRDR